MEAAVVAEPSPRDVPGRRRGTGHCHGQPGPLGGEAPTTSQLVSVDQGAALEPPRRRLAASRGRGLRCLWMWRTSDRERDRRARSAPHGATYVPDAPGRAWGQHARDPGRLRVPCDGRASRIDTHGIHRRRHGIRSPRAGVALGAGAVPTGAAARGIAIRLFGPNAPGWRFSARWQHLWQLDACLCSSASRGSGVRCFGRGRR
jgi:hypothetical protein